MKYPSSSIFNRDFLLKINVRNTFEIPELSHISINLTSRSLVAEKKHSLFSLVGLSLLSGQQPKVLRAKKSVAAFKLKKKRYHWVPTDFTKRKNALFFTKLGRTGSPPNEKGSYFFESDPNRSVCIAAWLH